MGGAALTCVILTTGRSAFLASKDGSHLLPALARDMW